MFLIIINNNRFTQISHWLFLTLCVDTFSHSINVNVKNVQRLDFCISLC